MQAAEARDRAAAAACAAVGGLRPDWVGPLGWAPVQLHEAGHAVAARLTGAQELTVSLGPAGAGLFASDGGWPTLVWTMGYLAAPLLGAGVVPLGRRWPGAGLAVLGSVLGLSVWAWTPELSGRAIGLLAFAGVLWGLALGLSDERARRLEGVLPDWLCAAALLDVLLDAWHHTSDGSSDAAQLSVAWGIPFEAVVLAWVAVITGVWVGLARSPR